MNTFRAITFKPSLLQFVIDELPLLVVCPFCIVYAGMEDAPLKDLAIILSVLLSLCLLYRFIYLKGVRYHIGSEQIVCEHGVFQRNIHYMELFRVVDFFEHRTLTQRLCGLKTVTVFSMDRTTPKLELTGMSCKTAIVPLIRERVEYNKQRKGIYEITNR